MIMAQHLCFQNISNVYTFIFFFADSVVIKIYRIISTMIIVDSIGLNMNEGVRIY